MPSTSASDSRKDAPPGVPPGETGEQSKVRVEEVPEVDKIIVVESRGGRYNVRQYLPTKAKCLFRNAKYAYILTARSFRSLLARSRSPSLLFSTLLFSQALGHLQGMFKPYKGDLFGTNGNKSGGLLYLSRMNVEEDPVVMQKAKLEKQKKQEIMDNFVQEERRLSKGADAKNLHMRDKKRRFAISLATLSSKADKREGIVADGAIPTLVKLSKMSDRQTQLSCASAFNSLASEPGIRQRMLLEGAVAAIVLLSASPLRKVSFA
jgi:hypothetical protein